MKRLLTVRDMLLSALAGYAVYTYKDWANTASAIYGGIVVAMLCACLLISVNEDKRQLRRRKRKEKK